MKNIKVISHLGAFLLALAISLPAQAQNMSGVMMVVKGDIKITSTDGKTDAGKVGRKVTAGDIITSGADSRAKIVMADKNVINVSPDSKIVIEKYENDGKDKKNVELNVLYGKVRASVEQKYDGEKNKFNIKTPSAVAGVRGTDFIAGYNSQTRVTQVITFSGSVALGQAGPGGSIRNPVFVLPGQMAQVGAGQAAAAPVQVPKEDLTRENSDSKTDTSGRGPSSTPNSGGPNDRPMADGPKEGPPPTSMVPDGPKDGEGPRGPASTLPTPTVTTIPQTVTTMTTMPPRPPTPTTLPPKVNLNVIITPRN